MNSPLRAIRRRRLSASSRWILATRHCERHCSGAVSTSEDGEQVDRRRSPLRSLSAASWDGISLVSSGIALCRWGLVILSVLVEGFERIADEFGFPFAGCQTDSVLPASVADFPFRPLLVAVGFHRGSRLSDEETRTRRARQRRGSLFWFSGFHGRRASTRSLARGK